MTVNGKSIGGQRSSVSSTHSTRKLFLRLVSHDREESSVRGGKTNKHARDGDNGGDGVFSERRRRETRRDDGTTRTRLRGRCVCVITVTAPLPRRRGPRGISYDHPAASASLGTGDQTNRLPIALPIIGTIDTGARHRHRRRPIERLGLATFEEDELKNRTSSSPGFSPVPRPCNNNRRDRSDGRRPDNRRLTSDVITHPR